MRLLYYDPHEGYERAGLYIQCRPFGADYLQPGSYLQQHTGRIVSPIMPDLATLFPWMRTRGWVEVKGVAVGLLYERPDPTFPARAIDPGYFGQTSTALESWDAAYPRWDQLRTSGTLAQLDRVDVEMSKALDKLREAFARDTADRNSRANAYLIAVDPPEGYRFAGHEISPLRRWVTKWRESLCR